ncbi:MAG: YabP/YqfC family sporulation protein [Tenericutes bacterium]|nr:YabP/YqfC family sporulation protein [Mycoplasmatota bacterium]
MFSKLRNYIKQEETKIYYRKNKLDIINYKKILIFEDNKILVEIIDDILEIKGANLIIKRFEKEELLVEGSIYSITFRGNYV